MKIIWKIFNTAKHVNLQLQRLQQPPVTFHTIKNHSTYYYHKTTLLQLIGFTNLKNYSQLDIYEFIHCLQNIRSTPFKHHSISWNTQVTQNLRLIYNMTQWHAKFLNKISRVNWDQFNHSTKQSIPGQLLKKSVKNCLWFQCFCMVLQSQLQIFVVLSATRAGFTCKNFIANGILFFWFLSR